MISNERFERLANRLGFKVTKVDGRPDILAVKYRGKSMMTIPKKMYPYHRANHRDLYGRVHPDFFEREHKLKNINLTIKRTPYLETLYEEERQIKA